MPTCEPIEAPKLAGSKAAPLWLILALLAVGCAAHLIRVL
jgi:hypothetical protein